MSLDLITVNKSSNELWVRLRIAMKENGSKMYWVGNIYLVTMTIYMNVDLNHLKILGQSLTII